MCGRYYVDEEMAGEIERLVRSLDKSICPERGFYEWNREKEKFRFERKSGGTLFLAGCFEEGKDRDRFVVLTTAANPSVLPVHDRMPLVLEKQEIDDWLLDDRAAETLLHKTPGLLKAKADYEQIRFPFV